MAKEEISNYKLPKTVSFITSSISKFTAEEYVPYQVELCKHVKAADPTKIKLPAGMTDEWNRLNEIGTEVNKVAAASVSTKAKRVKDAERDRLLTHLFGMVRQQRYSPIQTTAEAAERLYVAMTPYFGAQEKRFEVESGLILGLEKDLAKMSTDVAAVGIATTLTELHNVNEAYMALGDVSDVENIDRSKLPPITDVRSAIDKIHQTACQILQANYLTSTKDEERTAIETLADLMNQVTLRYKSRHNISSGLKKATTEKKPKDPKQPKGPKQPEEQPKDPKKPGGGDDIHLPEEPPKKPDEEQPKPTPGDGSGDDIHIPSEPPKKPDGVA